MWSELEGGAADGVRAAYGLQYSWAAGEDGSIELTVAGASEDAEGEAARRRALAAGDPVALTPVSSALSEGLRQAQAAHGQALHARLAQLDPAISEQLRKATVAPRPAAAVAGVPV